MPHVSLRPFIWTAPALYAKLQLDQANTERTIGRMLFALAGCAVAAVSGVPLLWQLGAAAGVMVFASLMHVYMGHAGRHWFMHRLTLQDCFDDAPWNFGGPDDADTRSGDVEARL